MKTPHDNGYRIRRLAAGMCEYAQSSGVIIITDNPSHKEMQDHHITGVLTFCLLLAPFLL